ncbi:MAG: twin-arginine translocase subunit TatC [Prevotellaceae bacterium]|nr:twin-arginine translocase subunit TatC [Prevotellaceae bacterium]
MQLTFWEHLDVLRGSLIRMIVASVIAGLAAFGFKDILFNVVLAPSDSSFFMFRLMGAEPFKIHLINTGLTEQFMIHMKVALLAGLLIASPYLLYVLFRFISPALYENERRISVRLTVSAYLMFLVGVLVNYLLIFPLTVHFLGTYQVSADIDNMLTISSYVDTLLMMTLVFGIVFEIPVVCWLLARFGMLKAEWMRRFRRHAIVVILIISAVITPTSDIFTLLIVSLPIWLLYELSILIVRMTRQDDKDSEQKKSE